MSIIHSPIIQALSILLLWFGISAIFLPVEVVNEILDAFCIAAGALVITRYWRQICTALTVKDPTGAQCLIASIGGVAFSIAMLRGLREFAAEVYTFHTVIIYGIMLVTVLLMFSLFLKVIAPPLPTTPKTELSPWAALVIALVSGAILSGALMLIRYG